MTDRVLPPLLILTIEREKVHDELINFTQCAHLVGRLLDGHRDEGDV